MKILLDLSHCPVGSCRSDPSTIPARYRSCHKTPTHSAGKTRPVRRDPLLHEAALLVIERGRASVVLVQRRLDIGYTRASRLMDALEKEGVVGPLLESGSREVLITEEEWNTRRSL